MNTNAIFAIAIVGTLVIVGFLSWSWTVSRTDTVLQNWANENGYQILSVERVWFSLDPFVMFAGKNRIIRRVEVQDQQGERRQALVRVGGYWLGLMSDTCEVKWMD